MALPKYSLLDLEGQRFGRLIALRLVYLESTGRIKYWECRCDCGNKGFWRPHVLVTGATRSCGCYAHDRLLERNTIHGKASRLNRHTEYGVWTNMRNRCNNPKHAQWFDYGGRGITVCKQWNDFQTFVSDMGPRPSLQHTIERIDNDGNYCPENCRWATRAEQALNYSRNHRIEFRGESLTISQWAKRLGMKQHALIARIEHGWTEEMALTIPIRTPRFVTYDGKTLRLSEWAGLLGVKRSLLEKRLRMGWSVEKTLTSPVSNSHQRTWKHS